MLASSHARANVTRHAAVMDVRGVVDLYVVVVEDRVETHAEVYAEMVVVLDVLITVQEPAGTHVVLAATHATEDVDKVVEAVVRIIVKVVATEVVAQHVLMYRSRSNLLLMELSRDLLMVPAIHIEELWWER